MFVVGRCCAVFTLCCRESFPKRHIFLQKKAGLLQKNLNHFVKTIPAYRNMSNNSWDMKITVEEVKAKLDNLIQRTRIIYDSIAARKGDDINLEMLQLLAELKGNLKSESGYLTRFLSLSPNKELRDASTAAEERLNEISTEMSMSEEVFKNLVALQEKEPNLDSQYAKFLALLIRKGKRSGLHLPKEVWDEMKEKVNRTNKLGSTFQKSLNEVTTTLEFTDQELDGLPLDFINELEKSPDTGKRKVSLKYPHYFPIMAKARNPETRKRLFFAFNTQCLENGPILEEMLTLRHDVAQKLGYPNHASFQAEICHSQSSEKVANFLQELGEKLKPFYAVEKATLLELKEKECKELNIPFDGKINDYDSHHYATKMEELYYNIDEDKYREYFPFSVVTERLLETYQKLLGLVFKEIKDVKVWHPDVKMFSVEDAASGQLMGHFFLDLFPREGKYGHAALFDIQYRYVKQDGTVVLPIGILVTNFTKPTSVKPSLLNHDEVTTFFHEFGHVMHQICCNSDISVLNDLMEMERDFLETPSQMLENWCWEPECLRILSCHYKENVPLPEDMMDALIKSRLANVAGYNLRQVMLSTVDQRLHSKRESSTREEYCKVSMEYLGVTPMEGTNFLCNFAHLANCYDSKYYSYLWSEVFSYDLFDTRFKNGHVLDPVVGMEYRKKILEVGQKKPLDDIFLDFLGREPNQKAFLIGKGLKIE